MKAAKDAGISVITIASGTSPHTLFDIQANRIHEAVGRTVRRTIHELGGTMPENLPLAENIKKVESREKKRIKAEQKKLAGG